MRISDRPLLFQVAWHVLAILLFLLLPVLQWKAPWWELPHKEVFAVALLVGSACGLINGLLIAYGNIVPFIATLAMFVSARGLAERLSGRQTQVVTETGFTTFFRVCSRYTVNAENQIADE